MIVIWDRAEGGSPSSLWVLMSLGTYQYSSKDVCEAWFWNSGDRPGLQKNILVLLCGKSVLKPQDQLTLLRGDSVE